MLGGSASPRRLDGSKLLKHIKIADALEQSVATVEFVSSASGVGLPAAAMNCIDSACVTVRRYLSGVHSKMPVSIAHTFTLPFVVCIGKD